MWAYLDYASTTGAGRWHVFYDKFHSRKAHIGYVLAGQIWKRGEFGNSHLRCHADHVYNAAANRWFGPETSALTNIQLNPGRAYILRQYSDCAATAGNYHLVATQPWQVCTIFEDHVYAQSRDDSVGGRQPMGQVLFIAGFTGIVDRLSGEKTAAVRRRLEKDLGSASLLPQSGMVSPLLSKFDRQTATPVFGLERDESAFRQSLLLSRWSQLLGSYGALTYPATVYISVDGVYSPGFVSLLRIEEFIRREDPGVPDVRSLLNADVRDGRRVQSLEGPHKSAEKKRIRPGIPRMGAAGHL